MRLQKSEFIKRLVSIFILSGKASLGGAFFIYCVIRLKTPKLINLFDHLDSLAMMRSLNSTMEDLNFVMKLCQNEGTLLANYYEALWYAEVTEPHPKRSNEHLSDIGFIFKHAQVELKTALLRYGID